MYRRCAGSLDHPPVHIFLYKIGVNKWYNQVAYYPRGCIIIVRVQRGPGFRYSSIRIGQTNGGGKKKKIYILMPTRVDEPSSYFVSFFVKFIIIWIIHSSRAVRSRRLIAILLCNTKKKKKTSMRNRRRRRIFLNCNRSPPTRFAFHARYYL